MRDYRVVRVDAYADVRHRRQEHLELQLAAVVAVLVSLRDARLEFVAAVDLARDGFILGARDVASLWPFHSTRTALGRRDFRARVPSVSASPSFIWSQTALASW